MCRGRAHFQVVNYLESTGINNLGYLESALCCRNILAGRNLYDVWNVNEDAEYHEAGGSGTVEALGSVRQVPQRVGRVA